MYYDLDKEAEYLVNETFEKKTLDASEIADNVLSCGSLYHEFDAAKKRVEGISVRPVSPAAVQKDKVTDIRDLMGYEDEDFIELAYLEILGRPSDEEGFRKMLAALRNGTKTREQILKSIEQSSEGKRLGAGLTGFDSVDIAEFLALDDKKFVRFAYQRILGRQPDPYGMRTRREKLATGDASKQEILEGLINSPEAQGRVIEIRGLGKESGNRRLFRFLSGIPVLGRGFRWFGNMLRVNRRLRSAIFREMQIEEELSERTEEISRASSQRAAALANMISVLEKQNHAFLQRMETAEKRQNAQDRIVDEAKQRLVSVERTLEDIAAEERVRQQQIEDIARRLESLENGFRSLTGYVEQIGENVRSLNRASEDYGRLLKELQNGGYKILPLLQVEISNLKAKLREAEAGGRHAEVVSADDIQPEGKKLPAAAPLPKGDPYSSIDYFDFENHFRGSREEIKKVQEIYLPYFEGRKNVLDLGCGRGEFTEMLMERGIGVTGVDLYPPYVEYMKMLGLPAVLDDAIDYLERQESTDGIFVGQVVEHIPVEQIIRLCRLAYKKLADGGYLIMETPNPTSLAIYAGAFFLDPSHNKPVHPLTLQYIAEKAGFTSVEILYTDSSRVPYSIPRLKEGEEEFKDFNAAMERVSNLLYGSQDYAVIARKQAAADGQ